MAKFKSTLHYFIVASAIIGLVFVIGCNGSEEKQKMSSFLAEYSKTLDEYSEVVNKADETKKSELEEKLNTYISNWTEMKIEMGSEITPQTLDKFDQEYQEITKKFQTLAKKS
jgi:t-SNARE complex subunit (syntaxin)